VQKTSKLDIVRKYRGCLKIIKYFWNILKYQKRYILVMIFSPKNFESFVAITQKLWQKSKWKSRVWQNATNSIGVSCHHPAHNVATGIIRLGHGCWSVLHAEEGDVHFECIRQECECLLQFVESWSGTPSEYLRTKPLAELSIANLHLLRCILLNGCQCKIKICKGDGQAQSSTVWPPPARQHKVNFIIKYKFWIKLGHVSSKYYDEVRLPNSSKNPWILWLSLDFHLSSVCFIIVVLWKSVGFVHCIIPFNKVHCTGYRVFWVGCQLFFIRLSASCNSWCVTSVFGFCFYAMCCVSKHMCCVSKGICAHCILSRYSYKYDFLYGLYMILFECNCVSLCVSFFSMILLHFRCVWIQLL